MVKSYKVLGLILLILGICLTPVAYIIMSSIFLTAIGLSIIILGITSIGLAERKIVTSSGSNLVIVEQINENNASILSRLKFKNKAIYLPRELNNGKSRVFIPLMKEDDIGAIENILRRQFTIRHLPNSEDNAIIVTTPGNISLDMLQNTPGYTADEIRAAITFILTNTMNSAQKVKVNLANSKIEVEILRPENTSGETVFHPCLGGPTSSIVAAVCSEASKKPVRIIDENNLQRCNKITVEVLS
jgi:hypothetical protein